jgi:SAM-dependent methyltransferase
MTPAPVPRRLGFDASAEEANAIWAANAAKWPDIGPPWRPSPGDIALYRRLAAEKLPGRTLILGATPELRDLLAQQSSTMPHPVVVDRSLPMLDAMTRLATTAHPSRERWHVADWCTGTLDCADFDLVLADLVWWTLPVAEQTVLRDRIAALLAPDGRFVSRIRCRDPRRAADDPQAVITRYLEHLTAGRRDEQALRGAMLSYLYDITADVAGRRMNRERTYALIASRRDAETDETRRGFLDVTLTRLIGANWTSQTRDEILPVLFERFELVAEATAADYDAAAYPIIALRKRLADERPG